MRKVPFNHQLKTTDQQFVAHLNLPKRSTHFVAQHFLTRKKPNWSFYSHGSPWHETDAAGNVLEKASNLLKHKFQNSWPPHQKVDLRTRSKHPDWRKGLAQAHTSIARHTFVCELTTAWALTGKIEFAHQALELMKSFVEMNPFILDPRFEEDHDTYFGGDADSTQMTSLRLFRWTDFLHSGALHALHSHTLASDDDVFWLVKQIWFYTMQFARLLGDPFRRDNHHLLDHGHTPFVMGLAFPEFDISKELVREGAQVIRKHFARNLLKDGAYAEHSTNYQYHVLFHYAHPHGVAKVNGYKLFTAPQVNQLRKWVEFSAHAGKPDSTLPSIGDEPGRPLHHLFGTLATPVMDENLAAMARGIGVIPGTHKYLSVYDAACGLAQPSSREKALSEYYKVVPGHRTQAVPRGLKTTTQYPDGGYTFFRDSWSPGSDYLAVSHFTGDYGTHAHWDPMSITLHTQGKTLIGDPASWLYVDPRFYGHGGDQRKSRSAQGLPYRGYSYSMNAHNCLVMNDDTLKPLSAMDHGTFWGGWPPQHGLGIFESGGPIEVAEIWHDGNAPTRHRRFVAHVVGIGFVFVDLLSKRPNLAPHQYSQYFHFEGDVQIAPTSPQDGSPLRAFDGGASCLIVPGAETESRWRTFRDPYLDKVYGVKNLRGAPWIAELTRRIRGQAVFTHFILTRDAAAARNARCRYLGKRPAVWIDWQHEGISANALDLGKAGKLIVASAPYDNEIDSPLIQTDAELAIAHFDVRGKLKSWCLSRGSKLIVTGKKLHAGRAREWLAR